jgi:drug/metabolite transporter (DMT)-like permease
MKSFRAFRLDTANLAVFVLDYGLLFWAEQRVPSGIAAVMMATIPAFVALSEIIFLRTQRLTVRLGTALLIGIAGVAVLMSRSLNLGGAPIDKVGAAALIFASMSWSVASTLTRKLPLPPSKFMSSGAQMLAGGVFLALTAAALGEFRNFHPWTVSRGAWFSLLYLIVAGSIIGFTAYVWLIHHESPTKVGTYAYVNPAVAVLVGYLLGGEALALRTILGTAFVLISVLAITMTPAKKQVATLLGGGYARSRGIVIQRRGGCFAILDRSPGLSRPVVHNALSSFCPDSLLA